MREVSSCERPSLLRLEGVGRTYGGATTVHALRNASFSVAAGELVGIVGRSGSGKSTLLNLLGLLDRPTAGRYQICERGVERLTDRDQTALRAAFFGFVFQQSFLLPSLSAQENVELALRPHRLTPRKRRERAMDALSAVGLADRRRFLPKQMSGGQCQRVAVARALGQQPRVLLCDEPTGNLDEQTSAELLHTLIDSRANGLTVIIVTHDLTIAQRLPRVLSVRDGFVVEDASDSVRSKAPPTSEE